MLELPLPRVNHTLDTSAIPRGHVIVCKTYFIYIELLAMTHPNRATSDVEESISHECLSYVLDVLESVEISLILVHSIRDTRQCATRRLSRHL